MANGDFAWLKLQLANMAGRSTVAQLDDDANLAGQCVNEAYLDCYMNPGGARPAWALQYFGIQFGAPITTSVQVTQGSTVVSGYTFPTNRLGCTVALGNSFYTYAGLNGASQQTFVEPVAETTGTYSITIYHSAYPLGVNLVEVEGAPLVLGWGLLSPMNSRKEQFRWQQINYGDFGMYPFPGQGGYYPSATWPGGVNYPTGTPLYYRIDNGPLGGSSAIQGQTVANIQSGMLALSQGDTSKAVAFNTTFDSTPTSYSCEIIMPDSSAYVIDSSPDRSTVTTSGFTANFGAGIPASGYYLSWTATGAVTTTTGAGLSDNTPRPIFNLSPMPLQITTIQFQGWVVPDELSADADLPLLPANLSTRILLPLIREKWALIYKKYTGGNQAALVSEANKARAILDKMAPAQRDKPVRQQLINC